MDTKLSAAFISHAAALRNLHRSRQEEVQLRSAIEPEPVLASGSVDNVNNGELGKRKSTDVFPGDARLRTLHTLLSRIDQRGFERCSIHALYPTSS